VREAVLNDALHYSQLEEGARYLAARASSRAERQTHLGWANRYYRLKIESLPQTMPEALSA